MTLCDICSLLKVVACSTIEAYIVRINCANITQFIHVDNNFLQRVFVVVVIFSCIVVVVVVFWFLTKFHMQYEIRALIEIA